MFNEDQNIIDNLIEEYIDDILIIPNIKFESLIILDDVINERQIQMKYINRFILEPTIQEEMIKVITEAY